jgi:hypothetical protein
VAAPKIWAPPHEAEEAEAERSLFLLRVGRVASTYQIYSKGISRKKIIRGVKEAERALANFDVVIRGGGGR